MKYTGFFLQSTTESLPTYSPLTHFTCSWLVGFRPLSLQGMSGQGRPTKKIGTSTEQKASLCDLPHPPWDKGWGLPLVPTGSQARRLSAPILLDGSPPVFSSPAGYRRQAGEKVLPQIQHCFQKSRHIYVWIYENDDTELKLRPKRAFLLDLLSLFCARLHGLEEA